MPMARICCYLDGSEDTDATIFGVGGFVGDVEEWGHLQPMWVAALPQGVDYFHATDCFSGNGQFKGIDIPERIKLLDTLTELIVSHNVTLICHGIDEAAYYRYASSKNKIDSFGQNKYGSCFGSAIGYACESMGPQQVEVEHGCSFVIEKDEYEATAKREFIQLSMVPAVWFRDQIATQTYGTKKGKDKVPLLQVADLGVFLGLKSLSRCRPGRIDWRPYYRKLKSTGHVFCCRKDGKRRLKMMYSTLQELKHGNEYRIPLG